MDTFMLLAAFFTAAGFGLYRFWTARAPKLHQEPVPADKALPDPSPYLDFDIKVKERQF
jgi:hypothetical protein